MKDGDVEDQRYTWGVWLGMLGFRERGENNSVSGVKAAGGRHWRAAGRWLSGLGSGEREDPAEGRGQGLSSTRELPWWMRCSPLFMFCHWPEDLRHRCRVDEPQSA